MDYYYTNKTNRITSALRDNMKLKVCGMNKNTAEVAALRPDYMGFIFWKPSKRYFQGDMPSIPHKIEKVGVFVNAPINEIKKLVGQFELLIVQLHGDESPAFCDELKKEVPQIKIIKVFSVQGEFDFKVLAQFEDVCDFYLFDTKGKLPGGNGYAFDWAVLKNYPSSKPYFLSGGIGMDDLKSIREFLNRPESEYCHAIDVNSKFEIEPGLKNTAELLEFKKLLTEKE